MNEKKNENENVVRFRWLALTCSCWWRKYGNALFSVAQKFSWVGQLHLTSTWDGTRGAAISLCGFHWQKLSELQFLCNAANYHTYSTCHRINYREGGNCHFTTTFSLMYLYFVFFFRLLFSSFTF